MILFEAANSINFKGNEIIVGSPISFGWRRYCGDAQYVGQARATETSQQKQIKNDELNIVSEH